MESNTYSRIVQNSNKFVPLEAAARQTFYVRIPTTFLSEAGRNAISKAQKIRWVKFRMLRER